MWRVLSHLLLDEAGRWLRRLFRRPDPPGRFHGYRDRQPTDSDPASRRS